MTSKKLVKETVKDAVKEPTTIVSFILDRSGSMNSIKDATITGFNEYVNGLKNQDKQMLFSLTTFDSDSIDHPYTLTPVKLVQDLNGQSYQPRSGTPLYDAVIETVEKLRDDVAKMEEQPAVLVAIMTDGEENSSTKHDEACLKRLVEKLQGKGNYTFVYMGANQDSWATAQKFGILAGNIINWDPTPMGTMNNFRVASASTVNYANTMMDNSAKGLAMSASNFFDSSATDLKVGGNK